MKQTQIEFNYFDLPVLYFNQLEPRDIQLIFDFFIVFSRFEFVLKKLGYLKTYDNDRVSPAWDKFCRAYENKFDSQKSDSLKEAVKYYMDYPTKTQVCINNHLSWKENKKGKDESEFAWIIHSIKNTRNNLFHGGKFPWDQVRDKSLLYYGLVILYACLEMDDRLHRLFNYSP